MFKKWKYLVLFALLQTFIVPTHISRLSAVDFSTLFEGIDFDQLAKDMELMLEEGEKEDQAAAAAAAQEDRLKTVAPEKQAKKRVEEPDESEKDSKTLFLAPIKIEQSSRDEKKGSYKFSKAKLNAYDHYMGLLVDYLKTIEKKIDASLVFSPEFKADFTQFKATIDEVVVSDALISDKKMYLRVFFLSNFDELRKKIVGAVEKLEGLNKRIAYDHTHEERISHDVKKRAEETPSNSSASLTPLEVPQHGKRGHTSKARSKKETKQKKSTSKKISSAQQTKNSQLETDLKALFSKEIHDISKTLSSVRKSKESQAEIQKKTKKREQQVQAARQRMSQSSRGGYGSPGYRRPSGGSSYGSSSPWDSSSSPWGGSGGGRNWGSNPSRWGQAHNPWDADKTADKKPGHDDKSDKDDKKNDDKATSRGKELSKEERSAKEKADNHFKALMETINKSKTNAEVAAHLAEAAQHITAINSALIALDTKKQKEYKTKLKGPYDGYYQKILNALDYISSMSSDGGLMTAKGGHESSLSTIYNAIASECGAEVVRTKSKYCGNAYVSGKKGKLQNSKNKTALEALKSHAEKFNGLLPYTSSDVSTFINDIAQKLTLLSPAASAAPQGGPAQQPVPGAGQQQGGQAPANPGVPQQAGQQGPVVPAPVQQPGRRGGGNPHVQPALPPVNPALPAPRGRRNARRNVVIQRQELVRLKANVVHQKDTNARYFDNYLENVNTILQEGGAHRQNLSQQQQLALRNLQNQIPIRRNQAQVLYDNAALAQTVPAFNNFVQQAEALRHTTEQAVLHAVPNN